MIRAVFQTLLLTSHPSSRISDVHISRDLVAQWHGKTTLVAMVIGRAELCEDKKLESVPF